MMMKQPVVVVVGELGLVDVVHLGEHQMGSQLVHTEEICLLKEDVGWSVILAIGN